MAFALRHLRLPPEQFWRLTPRELAVMAGGAKRAAAPERPAFDALMALYPDEVNDDG